MDELEILKAKVTLTEYVKPVHRAKRPEDLKNIRQAYKVFKELNEEIETLSAQLSQSEINNMILSTKVTKLDAIIENLKEGL